MHYVYIFLISFFLIVPESVFPATRKPTVVPKASCAQTEYLTKLHELLNTHKALFQTIKNIRFYKICPRKNTSTFVIRSLIEKSMIESIEKQLSKLEAKFSPAMAQKIDEIKKAAGEASSHCCSRFEEHITALEYLIKHIALLFKERR